MNQNAQLHVLILEDWPQDAELMVHELRRSGFDPIRERVEAECDYLKHLSPPPDVILADYTMPKLDACRALRLLQEHGLDIPFMVVTGTIGEEVAVAMIHQGAADYLLKDRLVRLGPAVKHALSETNLRLEKRRTEEELVASELRFRAFMRHSPALSVIKDESGRILYVSNASG
jgi:DNA-binding NtrC family response regulator